jgi:AcrR family transcriptional regulator
MKRTYNSRRRAESASNTRQSIIEAAVKLHGEGITTLSSVADKAGVSLPTLNKYFPTRDDLFIACTSHVLGQLEYPSPEKLRTIQNPGERLRQVVHAVYRLHEEIFGQQWTGYKLEDESLVLARVNADTEALIASLADTLCYDHVPGTQDVTARFVSAVLHPLTYRALRLKNGLNFEQAVDNMTLALGGLLNIEV